MALDTRCRMREAAAASLWPGLEATAEEEEDDNDVLPPAADVVAGGRQSGSRDLEEEAESVSDENCSLK